MVTGYLLILIMLFTLVTIICYFLKKGEYELEDVCIFVILTLLPIGAIIGTIHDMLNK